MELYSYWRSTAAYRVRIALNLKNAEYSIHPVDLLADRHESADYRQMNPQGLVPALVTDGRVLIQSTAITEYLEERIPEPPLLPRDPHRRAAVRGMCQLIACDIHPLNNLRVLNYLQAGIGCSDTAVNEWYRRWIDKGFHALETLLTNHRGDYCSGDSITMADVFLVPQVYNAVRFDCDLQPFPDITEIADRLLRQPAFEQAAPEQQPDAT